MINKLQQLLYMLAIIAPIPLITSMIFLYRGGAISPKIVVVIIVSVAIVGYHYWFLWYSKRHLARIELVADSVPEEADGSVIKVLLTYAAPFVEWVLQFQNVTINIWLVPSAVCIVAVIIMFSMNNTIASPWYILIGYHFHRIESADKKYTMMSREKNYRNRTSINSVIRIFDDLIVIVR